MTYEKAVTSTQYYDEIARAISEYGGLVSATITPSQMAEGVRLSQQNAHMEGSAQGYESGKKAFWDKYLQPMRDGKSTMYMFSGQSWNSETFFPTENIVPKANGTGLFAYFSWELSPYIDLAERLEECGVSLDTQYCNNFASMFANCYVTRLPKISVVSANGLSVAFNGMKYLQTIDELNLRGQVEIDAGKSYNSFDRTFLGCSALVNITVTGIVGNNISFADSSKLTFESVDRIIEALKTLEDGETAKTLTLHATVKTNMTDAQNAAIAEKGWTLA